MGIDEANTLDEQSVDSESIDESSELLGNDDQSDEVIDIKDLLNEAERERDQFHELATRSQAELANYRKRIVEERQSERKYFNIDLLGKLISISDDLNRATKMNSDQHVEQAWIDGVDLVSKNLLKIIESQGVQKIEATMNSQFDPHEHQAILFQDSEQIEEGLIIEVIQEGYKLHDRLIRATQVIVAKKPNNEQEIKEKNSEV